MRGRHCEIKTNKQNPNQTPNPCMNKSCRLNIKIYFCSCEPWSMNTFWGHTAKDKLPETANKWAKPTVKNLQFASTSFLLGCDESSFSAYWGTFVDCSHLHTVGCSTWICNIFQNIFSLLSPVTLLQKADRSSCLIHLLLSISKTCQSFFIQEARNHDSDRRSSWPENCEWRLAEMLNRSMFSDTLQRFP